MKSLRLVVAGAVLGAAFVGSTPASADRDDLVAAHGRAGPIHHDETTMGQMRSWFGDPTGRKRVRVGCIQAIRARWGGKLMVLATTETPRRVAAIFVQSRSVTSTEHGELAFHTRRGLRVGDRERKLRRLYPGADPITHAGHTHYRLATARNGGYLMGKVVDDRVVQLELWPYEFC
jgi:hypothetical protein